MIPPSIACSTTTLVFANTEFSCTSSSVYCAKKMAPINDDDIKYSDRYYDDVHEYRHVTVPKKHFKKFAKYKGRLLTEVEWRELGVKMSRGWVHYDLHNPEPHVLLFRRPAYFQNLPMEDQELHLDRTDELVIEAEDAMRFMDGQKNEEPNPHPSIPFIAVQGSNAPSQGR